MSESGILLGSGDANNSAIIEAQLKQSELNAQIAIEKMAKIARQPIDIIALKKRREKVKKVRLSTIAKKNPNF